MKMIDLTCPQCGANIEPDPKAEKAVCKYCGYQALLERKDTLEEIAAKAQSKSYGYHKGKLQAEAEMAKETSGQQNSTMKVALIVVIALVMIGVFAVVTSNVAKPKVNPFDYIKVSFEGTDGDGEVVIKTMSKDDVDANRIDYDISKMSDLIQGETISIVADSSEYRLTEKSKTYVVEGLDEYLKDIKDIPEESLQLIHQKAKSVQELNLSHDEEAFESMKPVKLFLLTDGERESQLYVVHEVTFATENGKIICYVSTCFNGVVLRKGAEVSVYLPGGIYHGNAVGTGKTGFFISGFESLDAVRADILTSQEKNMELTEKDY